MGEKIVGSVEWLACVYIFDLSNQPCDGVVLCPRCRRNHGLDLSRSQDLLVAVEQNVNSIKLVALNRIFDLHFVNLFFVQGQSGLAHDSPFTSSRKWLLGRRDKDHLFEDPAEGRSNFIRIFDYRPIRELRWYLESGS